MGKNKAQAPRLPRIRYVLLAASSTRLNHLPEFLAASIHCFVSVGKLNNDRSVVFETIRPALFLPSHLPGNPFPLQFPIHHSLVWVASRYPYGPRTPRKVSSVFAPSSRRSHSQSWRVRRRRTARGSRRHVSLCLVYASYHKPKRAYAGMVDKILYRYE